jgi:predicted phage-related endonuclease
MKETLEAFLEFLHDRAALSVPPSALGGAVEQFLAAQETQSEALNLNLGRHPAEVLEPPS